MKRRKNHFIEKSLLGAVAFFKDSVFSEEYASRDGFLQSLDPRLKTIGLAVFIIAVLFLKTIIPILALYFFVLLLAAASKIDILYFLKRTWIFIPLFSLFIALPAIFSIFSPGQPVLSFKLFNATLHVTRQGCGAASLFISRVITSVSIVVLLSLTTPHARILHALRVFGVPQVFIMTIGMSYRYIYLFAKIIEDTHLAIKSRGASAISASRGHRIASWNISSLWHRSFCLHKDVYNAMASRGYSGLAHNAYDFRANTRDWVWLAVSFAVSSALLFWQYKIF